MPAQNQNNNILAACFSWSGNAKALAGQIAAATGGDLFEIKTVKTCPGTCNAYIEAAKQEQDNNTRPALSGSVTNMAQYNTVFLCCPNWWGILPMGVFTFLESYNFSGKRIYPHNYPRGRPRRFRGQQRNPGYSCEFLGGECSCYGQYRVSYK
jgi:flavodoxin